MPEIERGGGVPPILAEIGAQGDLAANPQAIERLNQLLNKEYCTTLGLAHAILQDPGLSAKILRVVNSVAYSVRGEPVSTITRAILLLGFERVREIATGLLLIEQFTRRGAGNDELHTSLRRALRCGLTAQAISVRIGRVSPEQACSVCSRTSGCSGSPPTTPTRSSRRWRSSAPARTPSMRPCSR